MCTQGSSSIHQRGGERLSLCMIVKNEAAFIRECLESVRHIVDEIIIVDTGSNDDTIEICRSFGARVYTYSWIDDFAAARNYSLERATGDWILWLDADEVVEASDALQLREAICTQHVDFFAIRLINYFGDTPNLDESFQVSHLRLFRNHEGIQFENKIHERLNVRGIEHITNLPVRVYHYGYMPTVMKHKDKHTRNLQLLSAELSRPDYSPWIHYHIASEYYNLGQLDSALKQLDYGILKFILSGLKPPSMCYRLKYTALLQLGKSEAALSSIDKAIAIYPDYVDLYFMKGLLLMEPKRYAEAEATFGICTSLGEENWDYLTLKGVGSFRAWYYRGLCLEQVEQFESARKAYETSLSISPDFSLADEALAALRRRIGMQDA